MDSFLVLTETIMRIFSLLIFFYIVLGSFLRDSWLPNIRGKKRFFTWMFVSLLTISVVIFLLKYFVTPGGCYSDCFGQHEDLLSSIYSMTIFLSYCGIIVFLGTKRMTIFKSVFGPYVAVRVEACRIGMQVSDVERELANFAGDIKSVKLITKNIARYSLPRMQSNENTWELLKRGSVEESNMPNDYLLNTTGVISEKLLIEIKKLAQEYDDGYIEFEGTVSDVAVFLEESGGITRAQYLYWQLEALAKL